MHCNDNLLTIHYDVLELNCIAEPFDCYQTSIAKKCRVIIRVALSLYHSTLSAVGVLGYLEYRG